MSGISNFLQEENVITKEEKTRSNGRDFAEQKEQGGSGFDGAHPR